MAILANFMPGVRALRAPLAAGSLLLLAIWLAFESHVPAHPSSGVWASLDRLRPVASAIGGVGLAVFTAYVLGSLYLVAISGMPPLNPFGSRRQLPPETFRSVTSDDVRFAGKVLALLGGSDGRPKNLPSMTAQAFERLVVSLVAQAPPGLYLGSPERAEALFEDVKVHPDPRLIRDLEAAFREWDSLPLTIVGTQPAVYGEIDRFRAEEEFRTALLGPLALLFVVVGLRSGGWSIAISAVSAAIASALLAYASWDADRRANTLLANAIAAGLVPLPSQSRAAAGSQHAQLTG